MYKVIRSVPWVVLSDLLRVMPLLAWSIQLPSTSSQCQGGPPSLLEASSALEMDRRAGWEMWLVRWSECYNKCEDWRVNICSPVSLPSTGVHLSVLGVLSSPARLCQHQAGPVIHTTVSRQTENRGHQHQFSQSSSRYLDRSDMVQPSDIS